MMHKVASKVESGATRLFDRFRRFTARAGGDEQPQSRNRTVSENSKTVSYTSAPGVPSISAAQPDPAPSSRAGMTTRASSTTAQALVAAAKGTSRSSFDSAPGLFEDDEEDIDLFS